MMICEVNIIVTQITQLDGYVQRNKTFTINFANKVEVENTWKNLTDKATITLPRNIYIQDSTGKMIPMGIPGQVNTGKPNNINIGGVINTVPPLFLRGDRVTIQLGYSGNFSEILINQTANFNKDGFGPINTVFTGFISQVVSGIPIVLHCEDNMWALKQLLAPNKKYPAAVNNVGSVFADLKKSVLAAGTIPGFNVVQGTPTFPWNVNMGNFQTKNETWSQVLDRLRKDFHLYFYFRSNILRAGGVVYYPEDLNVVGNFGFETNIFPDDHLNYQRKQDVNVGAQCYSIIKVKQSKTNATGGIHTIDKRLQAVCYSDPNGNLIGSATEQPDKNSFTEFFTFFFDNVLTAKELIQKGIMQLQRFYYDGFRGKFSTFGLPFLQHGNLANLTSTVMPERNGQYIVKSVKTTFSADTSGGLQQEIELHFRTDQNDVLATLQQTGG